MSLIRLLAVETNSSRSLEVTIVAVIKSWGGCIAQRKNSWFESRLCWELSLWEFFSLLLCLWTALRWNPSSAKQWISQMELAGMSTARLYNFLSNLGRFAPKTVHLDMLLCYFSTWLWSKLRSLNVRFLPCWLMCQLKCELCNSQPRQINRAMKRTQKGFSQITMNTIKMAIGAGAAGV